MASAGVPEAFSANQGRATISTKLSETSLRQINDDQSGCSDASIRPTSIHLTTVVTPAATAPPKSITTPESAIAAPRPSLSHSRLSSASTRRAIQALVMPATMRSSSHSDRAIFSRSGGLKVRESSASAWVRRSRVGGLPSQLDPRLALRGVEESTATRPLRGTVRPGPAMPLLPRKARRPTLAGPICIHPPPSS